MTTKHGNKHTCFKCDSKFYDLHNEQVICPKCGEDQSNAPKPKKKASSAPPKKRGRKAFKDIDELSRTDEHDDDLMSGAFDFSGDD